MPPPRAILFDYIAAFLALHHERLLHILGGIWAPFSSCLFLRRTLFTATPAFAEKGGAALG